VKIPFTLNGNRVTVKASSVMKLVDLLSREFGLESLKSGCRSGECGACLILVEGELMNACLIPAFRVRNKKVQTYEGLVKDKLFSDIVQVFAGANILPWDFLGPSLMISSYALLSRMEKPGEREIREALEGTSCHWSGYPSLVAAIAKLPHPRKGR